MAKIIVICGKICSGKTYYSNWLKDKENAVILSCDELTKDLFDNELGEKHDEMSVRIWCYLKKKSVELVTSGCNVILDWGFWTSADRKSLTEFYRTQNITCEWHYIDVDDQTWKKNIEERNSRVLNGEGGSDYYLDEGLMGKLLSKWEAPAKEEIDVWYSYKRNMWKCPKCGREFKRTNQGHYCGKAPANVNEYIESQDFETHAHLMELRNIILNNVPEVSERIAWSMPMFEKEKKSVSFAACKKHISLYIDLEILDKFKSKLSEYIIKKNAIYFPYNKTLPVEVIADIVKQCFDTK